jgi:hypothetical protein
MCLRLALRAEKEGLRYYRSVVCDLWKGPKSLHDTSHGASHAHEEALLSFLRNHLPLNNCECQTLPQMPA